MFRAAFTLLLIPAGIAASAPVAKAADPIAAELAQARAEASAAQAEARRLSQAAARHRDAASRLGADVLAAAQAIAQAEAEISAADVEARLLSARLAQQQAVLRQQQAPATALLGGLAMMAQRPPLLSLVERGETEEFVRVRILLDSTLPEIRRRTAALGQRLERGRKIEAALAAAKAASVAKRQDLVKRQVEFAALEERALRSAEATGQAALGAGDLALSRDEAGDRLDAERQRGRSAARIAGEVAALGAPPPRPFAAEGKPLAGLSYQLPTDAPITIGTGSVSDSGIRARGITMATRRGASLSVPADGRILFASPYRRQDGIIIIDHGAGWKSLILNATTAAKPGDRVRGGEPLGRALGPIGVELSRNGQHQSPALIAGSSANLSKADKSS